MSENDSDLNVIVIHMEFAKKLKLFGLPPPLLEIKRGSIVVRLHNINKICGLFNGTSLILDDIINKHILKATVANGDTMGSTYFIPMIALKQPDGEFSFRWQRKKFPVRLAFATTVNKSQSQLLGRAVLFSRSTHLKTTNCMFLGHGFGEWTDNEYRSDLKITTKRVYSQCYM